MNPRNNGVELQMLSYAKNLGMHIINPLILSNIQQSRNMNSTQKNKMYMHGGTGAGQGSAPNRCKYGAALGCQKNPSNARARPEGKEEPKECITEA
jgi:hypothetical protein